MKYDTSKESKEDILKRLLFVKGYNFISLEKRLKWDGKKNIIYEIKYVEAGRSNPILTSESRRFNNLCEIIETIFAPNEAGIRYNKLNAIVNG